MPENQEIEIRSDEVQEILSHVPSWMIRWGITVILVLILMVLAMSYVIKYPDVVSAQAIVTTEQPPLRLVNKVSGQITTLHVLDGTQVQAGDVIAEMENPVPEGVVLAFTEHLENIKNAQDSGNLANYQLIEFNQPLGEWQQNYNELIRAIRDFKELGLNQLNKSKIGTLEKQITNQKRLAEISRRQLALSEAALRNAQIKFEADKKLYDKGAISRVDFMNEETKYQQAQREVHNINATLVQQEITLNDLVRQITDLRFDTNEKLRVTQQQIDANLAMLQNAMFSWQQNYQLIAPQTGRLIYLNNWTKNQVVQMNTEMFAVIPENTAYYVQLRIPVGGAGKVKKNQRVNIQVANFPHQEFGQLTGYIETLPELPTLNGEIMEYTAKVRLPDGLLTSYKRVLIYQPEMQGTAEIITEDLRVIERVFNQFRKIFDR
jgi:multidrug efflux pump subunit AcrA (membrane-fusion protein)